MTTISLEEELRKKESRRERLSNLPLEEKLRILIEIQKLAEIAGELGQKKDIKKHWELEE